MLVNDIKKGMAITMTGGRYGKMMDNKKGNIRMVEVTNGMFGPEIGSIYSKDILTVEVNGKMEPVELSDRQKDAAKRVTSFGF